MSKSIRLSYSQEFIVASGNVRAQAAPMTLKPKGKEGGIGNNHRGSDQWLYVVSGKGLATVGRKSVQLKPGKLLYIKMKIDHEICNTGRTPLKTLNLYVPPAYRADGSTLPRGRPK